jgi:hypothetical protein
VLGTGTTVFGQPAQLEVPDPNNLGITTPSPQRPPLQLGGSPNTSITIPGKKPAKKTPESITVKQTAVKPQVTSPTMDPSPASMDPLPGQLKTPKKKFQ